jgi:predicted hotdog family 3-hydroxylacyl-ACP dehydratase
MLIERNELCDLIPHAGSMCLLDCVLSWDESEIYCSAISHIDRSNPLRNCNRLASVHLLEYGAQAMAVHGGLMARESGHTVLTGMVLPGYLAALHDVVLQQEFIDHIKTPLKIHAQKIASSCDSSMYKFTITTKEDLLASARATVIANKSTS